jgi:hypothetical protein
MRSCVTSILPLALVLASGCYHATELAAVWREPSAGPIRFSKPVTVFVTTDEGLRRAVEDQLVAKFPNATPSYRVMPNAADVDKNAIVQRMRDAGFDGAVTMRVVNVQDKVTYYPGAYWGDRYGFGGYWGSSWAYPYSPYYGGGYANVHQVVTIETQIYSLRDDRLIFAARSETTDKSNVGSLIRSVMRHIDKELKKEGMIAAEPRRPDGAPSAAVAGR